MTLGDAWLGHAIQQQLVQPIPDAERSAWWVSPLLESTVQASSTCSKPTDVRFELCMLCSMHLGERQCTHPLQTVVRHPCCC